MVGFAWRESKEEESRDPVLDVYCYLFFDLWHDQLIKSHQQMVVPSILFHFYLSSSVTSRISIIIERARKKTLGVILFSSSFYSIPILHCTQHRNLNNGYRSRSVCNTRGINITRSDSITGNERGSRSAKKETQENDSSLFLRHLLCRQSHERWTMEA